MSRRQRALVAILGAGAAALLLLLARNLFERVEETVDRGYSGEAAIHPFFALKELFSEMGIPTRTVSDLRRLPPADHVLWIAAPTRGSQPERLVSWASEGGHLVVLPVGPWDEDPLLAALGIRRFGKANADDNDHLSQPQYLSTRPAWPLLHATEAVELLRFEGEPDAAWMLTIKLGDGAATVLSDGAFLRNDVLDRHDHALIAWTAAVLDREPAGLWIAYRDPRPSVWVLMSARARPVAISLAVLVLAALIFYARRFGPRLESTPPERRQLAEHVRATGDFLWSVGCEDALLDAQRQALGRRLGYGRQASGPELESLARKAAGAAGLDQDMTTHAVSIRTTHDRREFTHAVHTLEALRRSS